LKKTPFVGGDSVRDDFAERMARFLDRLDKVICGDNFVEVIIDDPAGNSYVQVSNTLVTLDPF
jgi:C4-type Zn-finger protein